MIAFSPIHVLLIEDDPGEAVLFRELTEHAAGFSLTHIAQLEQALEALTGQSFDAVVLDLHRPDASGLDALRRLRQVRPGLPVIVLAAHDDEEFALRAVQAGAQDYLIENQVRGGMLVRSIRHAVERQRAEVAIARQNERLRILHQIDRSLMAAEGPEAIAAACLPPLRELLGVPRAIVNLFNLAAGEVEWLAAAGRRRVHVGPGVRYSIRLMGDIEALRRGESQLIDVHALPPGPEVDALLASGVRTYVVVPMIAAGELIGALSFGGEEGPFSQEQITIAREAATQFAIALMQTRLHERILRQAQELRSAFEYTNVPMVLTDANNRFLRVNAAFAQMFGYSQEEMVGLSMPDITHPEDLAASYAEREKLKAGQVSHFTLEKRYLHRNGKVLWGLANVSLIRDPQGRPLQYVGHVQDVTERKHLEDQFHQAQKMEAVGQLAGGVAHDFNNLLTIIGGSSRLIQRQVPPDSDVGGLAQQINEAGERAAALTRQLLAFSRKQVLEPKVLSLNAVVTGAEKMLSRLIGEDVRVSAALDPALNKVKADPGQLEQVIMNLAVNARDAMPQGGRLTIETANVELDHTYTRAFPELRPGRYVLLAVSDTGTGMDEATRARVFEPFFTTKEQGKGTGLGLSTVFGIVKQSGGHVAVYSELGHGTTFKVYLPMIEDAAPAPASAPGPEMPTGGTETILLAEDEPMLRSITAYVLEDQGHTVLQAGDGEAALRVAADYAGTIHLLVTDVVMPGISGRQVGERLAALRPGLKVLYLSGYTDDAVVRHGVLQAKTAFLQKPFTPEALAAKVREVLDQ